MVAKLIHEDYLHTNHHSIRLLLRLFGHLVELAKEKREYNQNKLHVIRYLYYFAFHKKYGIVNYFVKYIYYKCESPGEAYHVCKCKSRMTEFQMFQK